MKKKESQDSETEIAPEPKPEQLADAKLQLEAPEELAGPSPTAPDQRHLPPPARSNQLTKSDSLGQG